jgi:hypothetical protein
VLVWDLHVNAGNKMKRKIAILMIPLLIITTFFFAPRNLNYVAATEETTLSAIFGDIRTPMEKLCREKSLGDAGSFEGTFGAGSKDGWGEEIHFIWKNNGKIILRSGGDDRVKGTSDDVVAVASCNDPGLKRANYKGAADKRTRADA